MTTATIMMIIKIYWKEIVVPTLTVGYNRCPSKPDGRSRIVMTIVTIWPSLTIISMMTSFLKFLFHWLSALLAQVLIGHTIGFRQFWLPSHMADLLHITIMTIMIIMKMLPQITMMFMMTMMVRNRMIETKVMMKMIIVNFLMIRVPTLAVWGRGGCLPSRMANRVSANWNSTFHSFNPGF